MAGFADCAPRIPRNARITRKRPALQPHRRPEITPCAEHLVCGSPPPRLLTEPRDDAIDQADQRGELMHGKTCLITGATSGIGLEAAEELARRGASLILVGRDAGRGAAALARVRGPVPDAQIAPRTPHPSRLAQPRPLSGGPLAAAAALRRLV